MIYYLRKFCYPILGGTQPNRLWTRKNIKEVKKKKKRKKSKYINRTFRLINRKPWLYPKVFTTNTFYKAIQFGFNLYVAITTSEKLMPVSLDRCACREPG